MEMILSFLPIILVFVVFYLMMIVPEKKRKKEYSEMITGLKMNDEIMTRGGIIGKIVSLDDDTIVLESSSNKTRIKLSKGAIANKMYKEDLKKEKKEKKE